MKDSTKRQVRFIVYMGIAFYAGMKLNQLSQVTHIKVGKFVIEVQNQTACPEVSTSTSTPSPTKVESQKSPETPETDVSEVLEPEKVEEQEPTMDDDAYSTEEKLAKCYDDFEERKSTLGYWDFSKELYECKKMEFLLNYCTYLGSQESLNVCEALAKKTAEEQTDKIRDEYFGYTAEKAAKEKAEKK